MVEQPHRPVEPVGLLAPPGSGPPGRARWTWPPRRARPPPPGPWPPPAWSSRSASSDHGARVEGLRAHVERPHDGHVQAIADRHSCHDRAVHRGIAPRLTYHRTGTRGSRNLRERSADECGHLAPNESEAVTRSAEAARADFGPAPLSNAGAQKWPPHSPRQSALGDPRAGSGGAGRLCRGGTRRMRAISSPSSDSRSSSARASACSFSRFVSIMWRARGGALHHDPLDLGVDEDRGLLAEVLGAGHLAAEEDVLLALAEGERAHPVGHAPLADHLAGHVGGLLEIVPRAGGLLLEHDLLGGAAAQQDRDAVDQVVPRVVVLVVGGELLGEAQRAAARDDRDLVQRIGARAAGRPPGRARPRGTRWSSSRSPR